MYILLEKCDARCDTKNIYDYDAMGYTTSEAKALAWCDENPEYRAYKYCPDKEV